MAALKDADGAYVLVGADGSPYSLKVRAALRYKRIAHRWLRSFELGGDPWSEHFADLRAKVIPVLVRPDGSYANDSTPLLAELDETCPARPLTPRDPALAFLAALLEDFSDEWGTKIMFEGRFHTAKDAEFGASWQMRQGARKAPPEAKRSVSAAFAARQRQRRSLVGSTDWVVMERTLRRICSLLEENLDAGHQFLFGAAPTNADFALFGQLSQIAFDPLPSQVVHQYPGAWAWVRLVDDLSGATDPDPAAAQLTPAARGLLSLASETYLPFLQANEAALLKGAPEVRVDIFQGDAKHVQPPFKYQVRCLHELRSMYARLDSSAREAVDLELQNAGAQPGLWSAGAKL